MSIRRLSGSPAYAPTCARAELCSPEIDIHDQRIYSLLSMTSGGCLTAPESLALDSTGLSPMLRRAIADSPAMLWSSTRDAYGNWSRGKVASCSLWTN